MIKTNTIKIKRTPHKFLSITSAVLVILFLGQETKAQPAYVYHDKGADKLEAGYYAEAVKDFDIALSKDKQHVPSLCDRGRANALLKKNEEALRDFSAALVIKSDYSDAYYYRGLLYFSLDDSKAIDDFSKTIKLSPERKDAYLKRGLMLMKKQREQEAYADFNKLIEMKAAMPEAYLNRGKLNAKNKKTKEAIADYNEAIKLNPMLLTCYLERGKLALATNQPEAALKDFNYCASNAMHNEDLYLSRAEALMQLNKTDDALRDYNMLIETFKTKDWKIYMMRAQSYVAKQDYAKAMKDCSKIMTLNKDIAAPYLLRGQLYQKQGKTKFLPALTDFKKALELEPGNVQALTSKATILYETAKFAEAIAAYDELIKKDASAANYYLRSKCHYKLNDMKNCCKDLNEAALMGHKEAKKDLGVVCR